MKNALPLAFLFLAACSSTGNSTESPFIQPNSIMAGEIQQRVDQIPFQHRDELLHNLVWLTEQGEQVIPTVLKGLKNDNAKVRSSCAWVLGQIKDRRTVPNLRELLTDRETPVRTEVARTLVLMGDLAACPTLIEGLDSDRREVRYMCHEALKTATGHDFGYDHLAAEQREQQQAVLRWRQWWGEYSGDNRFATAYQQQHNLNGTPAAPAAETAKPAQTPIQPQTPGSAQNSAESTNSGTTNTSGTANTTPNSSTNTSPNPTNGTAGTGQNGGNSTNGQSNSNAGTSGGGSR
ncbi:MAG: hypothetical protein RL398_1685 [Planctomycetota bacterium]